MLEFKNKIKILIVCSGNSGRVAPFINEQVESLKSVDIEPDLFIIKGKGVFGYLENLALLKKKINKFKPDLIHAHYGLSALLANLQRGVPVVSTYHGSDINEPGVYMFSRLAILLSKYNIFVSKENIKQTKQRNKLALIPCGVNLFLFTPQDKNQARAKLKWSNELNYILFSGSFDNQVKNPGLAINAVSRLKNVKLIELKSYSREEVAILMNAADLCLLTSHSEGSPQFIKEAMACNCPIVSVNVGDVANIIDKVEGCYMTSSDIEGLTNTIEKALEFNARTIGRQKLIELNLDLNSVAIKIRNVYLEVLNKMTKQ